MPCLFLVRSYFYFLCYCSFISHQNSHHTHHTPFTLLKRDNRTHHTPLIVTHHTSFRFLTRTINLTFFSLGNLFLARASLFYSLSFSSLFSFYPATLTLRALVFFFFESFLWWINFIATSSHVLGNFDFCRGLWYRSLQREEDAFAGCLGSGIVQALQPCWGVGLVIRIVAGWCWLCEMYEKCRCIPFFSFYSILIVFFLFLFHSTYLFDILDIQVSDILGCV